MVINGKTLTSTCFADDALALATRIHDLQRTLNIIVRVCKDFGMALNEKFW